LISAFMLQLIVPGIVRAVYVRPNEISIERPYIERHIAATALAFGLNRNATEQPFIPSAQGTVDPAQDSAEVVNTALDRVRAELLRRMGFADVLTPRALTSPLPSAA